MTKSLSWQAIVRAPGENALLIVAAASVAALAVAHGFEKLGGLAPCPLCLDQREVHWAASAFAIAGWAVGRVNASPLGRIATLGAGALIYLAGFVIAGFHAGVEYGLWPGPANCGSHPAAAPGAADVLRALEGAQTVVPCDEAAWRFLGVSMAGYNALLSLAAGLFLTENALELRRRRRGAVAFETG